MIKTLLISFTIAVLSGLGVGSGGLLVIYLTRFSDIPQITAQGINLLFFLFSASAASLVNIKSRKIMWSCVITMSIAGIGGCLIGTFLAGILGNTILRKIFGAMLIITGAASIIKMIFQKKKD